MGTGFDLMVDRLDWLAGSIREDTPHRYFMRRVIRLGDAEVHPYVCDFAPTVSQYHVLDFVGVDLPSQRLCPPE